MHSKSSRRDLLRGALLAGAGLTLFDHAWARPARSPNERIAFACIGIGGKGESDTADAARFGDVLAICDVDRNRLAEAAKRYPNAKQYTDFRKLLEEVGKSIDAVTISTPDHTHAPAAAMAMRMGKHCFCQKPLTRSLLEARRLAEIARSTGVATQMGNQGTADAGLRTSAARIRAGAVGKVMEVHVWTNRPIWPQGIARPAKAPVPPELDWDSWLGPAPFRDYGQGYHPFAWRGFWDFGTGALGDMACHTLNMPFMALDLRNPTSVIAESSGHNRDSYPAWSVITYTFAATAQRGPIKLVWYDGGKKPPEELLEGRKMESSGSLIIGDKGTLYTPGDYGGGGQLIGGAEPAEIRYEQSPGHFEEFIRAILEKQPAMSNFPGYAGPLTETVLLGNLAVWAGGKTIRWDSKNLRATNAPEVDTLIRPKYRSGYSL